MKGEEFIEHMALGGSSLGTVKRYLEAIRTLDGDGKCMRGSFNYTRVVRWGRV